MVSSVAHAQLYNDASITNDGNTISDYSLRWYNTTSGSYIGKAGAVFEHYGPSSQTFVNNGSFSYGAGGMTDKFLGPAGASGAQEIGGSTGAQFYNLVLNNGSAAAINITNIQGAFIWNSVSFQNGITTTARNPSTSGVLYFESGAIYSGTLGATRHVNGYVGRQGNAAFTFPVGDGSQYCPLSYVTPPSGNTDVLNIAYINGDPGVAVDPTGGAHNRSSISTAGTTGTTKIVSVSPVGFWDWYATSGTSPVTFSISIPDLTSAGGYATGSQLRVVGWNIASSHWENLSGSTGGSSNVQGTLLTGTIGNMASYSAIGIGSVSSFPLPITFASSLTTNAAGCSICLDWKLSTVTNYEDIVVERSSDGVQWAPIDTVKKQAAIAGITTGCRLTDSKPFIGRNYYRLRLMTDGGEHLYSNISVAATDCVQNPAISVAPNPFNESFIISGLGPGGTITVTDAQGRFVFSGNADASATLSSTTWVPGQYFLHVWNGAKEIAVIQLLKK